MKRSDDIKELATALAKAQGMMRHAVKDSTNPHFKSKYADLASVLEAIREPFAANGLSLSQHPFADGDKIEVVTLLLHSSGQFLESDLAMKPQQNTPQSIGSAITYARRYAAMSVAGLATDDDDGNAGSGVKASDHRQDVPFQGPPAKLKQPEPAAKAPSLYDGSSRQQEIVEGILKQRGVPEALWERVHETLLGRPSTDIAAVIKEVTTQ
jgi:hypothetical protein